MSYQKINPTLSQKLPCLKHSLQSVYCALILVFCNTAFGQCTSCEPSKPLYNTIDLVPASPLLPALYSNLKDSILESSENPIKIKPHITHLSYCNSFSECNCVIDFFNQSERVGQIDFTCEETKDPNIKEVRINLILVKNSYQKQGLGKAIMECTMNFFQDLAKSTDTCIIFYLLSARIECPPKWSGEHQKPPHEQRKIRNNFYQKMGLTMATPSKDSEDLPNYHEKEPYPFGAIFNGEKIDIPYPFNKSGFPNLKRIAPIELSKNLDFKNFFKRLSVLLSPFFYPEEKLHSITHYANINELFWFEETTQKSYPTKAKYEIKIKLQNKTIVHFPLVDTSRLNKDSNWAVIKPEKNTGWATILQKAFSAPFKNKKIKNTDFKICTTLKGNGL